MLTPPLLKLVTPLFWLLLLLLLRLIDDVEIEDDPVDEPEFWLFETKLLTEFDLLPLLLFDDEEEISFPEKKKVEEQEPVSQPPPPKATPLR